MTNISVFGIDAPDIRGFTVLGITMYSIPLPHRRAMECLLWVLWRENNPVIKTIHCTCECIHESWQGPVEHFEEWIPDGKLLRATKSCVFQDVRNSGAVHWSRTEGNTEMAELPSYPGYFQEPNWKSMNGAPKLSRTTLMDMEMTEICYTRHVAKFIVISRAVLNWGHWCQKQVSQAGISNYLSLPRIPASGTNDLNYNANSLKAVQKYW